MSVAPYRVVEESGNGAQLGTITVTRPTTAKATGSRRAAFRTVRYNGGGRRTDRLGAAAQPWALPAADTEHREYPSALAGGTISTAALQFVQVIDEE
jgi:hypothetical protein